MSYVQKGEREGEKWGAAPPHNRTRIHFRVHGIRETRLLLPTFEIFTRVYIYVYVQQVFGLFFLILVCPSRCK